MIPAPRLFIGGAEVPASPAYYPTGPVALAPLTLRWGRTEATGQSEPASLTVTVSKPLDATGWPGHVGDALHITTQAGSGYPSTVPFLGTISAESMSIDTARRRALITYTALDLAASASATRITVPESSPWPRESARARVLRVLQACLTDARLAVPALDTSTSPALWDNLVAAALPTNTLADDLLTPAANGAGVAVLHTPTGATGQNARLFTLAPWGRADTSTPITLPSARVLADTKVSTSVSAGIQQIEVGYHYQGDGLYDYDEVRHTRQQTFASPVLKSMSIDTHLAEPTGSAPEVDQLITAVHSILEANAYRIDELAPALGLDAAHSVPDATLAALIAPSGRTRPVQLTGVPSWLGLGSTIPCVAVGGTLTYDGGWSVRLNLARV